VYTCIIISHDRDDAACSRRNARFEGELEGRMDLVVLLTQRQFDRAIDLYTYCYMAQRVGKSHGAVDPSEPCAIASQ
jgi:hypothetical protein